MRLFVATLLGLAAILIGCTPAAPAPTVDPSPPASVSAPSAEPTPAPSDLPATATDSPTAVPPTETPAPTIAPSATLPPTATEPATLPQVFITLQDFEIVPAETTIPVGTEVVFLIKGAPGSLHQPYNFDPPNVFESPPGLGDGARYAYTFNEPGILTVGCGYHPNMIATIIVTP